MEDFQQHNIPEKFLALGIDISRFEESFVNNMLERRMTETKRETREAYFGYLEKHQNEAINFESLLQNHYSEFFRNPLTFSVLEKIVFPSLIAEKKNRDKELRIWSAACAAGQEPYSLAMLLEENDNSRDGVLRYRIFATDKSKSQITSAINGIFSPFSLGQVSMNRLSRWFDPKTSGSINNRYLIDNKLKRNIDFSVFDLLDGQSGVPPSSIFGNFDVVFCANLLFYYKPPYREIIIEKITKSMAGSSLLVVGETEREIVKQKGHTELFHQSGIFHK